MSKGIFRDEPIITTEKQDQPQYRALRLNLFSLHGRYALEATSRGEAGG